LSPFISVLDVSGPGRALPIVAYTHEYMRADFMKRRDELASKMTSAQIAEAQKLAREWKSPANSFLVSATRPR